MAQEIASLYARIGADTSGLERGLSRTKAGLTNTASDLRRFNTQFNDAFIGGISRGTITLQDFGGELLRAADKAGLGTGQIERIASATGIFSEEQLAAGRASDALARRSRELTQAVQRGELTTREAGRAFRTFANEQLVAVKSTQSLGTRLQGLLPKIALLTTGVVGFGIVAKTAFDFAKQGAQLEYAELRFNRLASSIGTTGDALEKDLRKATRGLLSDAQLMASAGDLMALGLVKTHDQAVRLTNVAAQLGMNMNQLVLTLTNQTTMRFDALGVSVDGFKERLEALEAQGLSTNEAFTEAFLQQAEDQIRRVGGIADTSAGSFMQFEAAVANAGDELKRSFLPAIEPLITFLTLYLRAFGDANRATEEGGPTYRRAAMAQAAYTRVVAEQTAAQDAALATQIAYYQGMGLIAAAQRELAESVDLGVLELGLAGRLEEEKEAFKLAAQEIAFEMQGIQNEIDRLSSLPFLSPEQQSQLVALRNDLATLRGEYTAQADAHAEATRRILVDLALQRIATLETTGTLDIATANAARSMVFNMAQAWGLIDQTTVLAVTHMDQVFAGLADGSIKDVQAETLRLKSYLDSLVGVYPVNIVVTTSFLEQNPEVRFAPGFVPPGAGAPTPISGGGGGGFAQLPSLENEIKKLDPGRMALQLAQAYSQIGSTAASSLRTLLIDPLQEQIEAIDKLMGPGFIDIGALDRSAELEQMRAEAAERVAEAQEKILALEREQQRLAFLESQVRLLDLIEQNGLNAAKIFEGIDFTDPLSVIEATTRALQEQIAKAAEKLGITIPTLPTGGGPISTEIPPVNTAGSNNLTVQLVIENVTDQIDVEVMAQRVAEVVKYRLLT
jgi:hypothetical protein